MTRKNTICLFCLLVCFISPKAFAHKQLQAFQLTSDNIQLLPDGGIDAIGGEGDWLLSNGVLCAVISGVEHQAYLSTQGGTLVDLFFCHSPSDQWVVTHDQFNLKKEAIPRVNSIKAISGSERAVISVESGLYGVFCSTRYILTTQKLSSLLIETSCQRKHKGEKLKSFGNLVLHPRGVLKPFSISHDDKKTSNGFDLPYIDTSSILDILSSVSKVDLRVLTGAVRESGGIAYGFRNLDAFHVNKKGIRTPLNSLFLGSETFTLQWFFTGPSPGKSTSNFVIRYLMSRFSNLKIGESFVFRNEIIVGDRSDVASVTDQVYKGSLFDFQLPAGAGQTGIHVSNTDGAPLSFVRTDNESFSFRAPEGVRQLVLDIENAGGKSSFSASLRSSGSTVINLKKPGSLVIPEGRVMSLAFFTENRGQWQPYLLTDFSGLKVGGEKYLGGTESNRVSVTGEAKTLHLPEGYYRIIASRGLEYSVADVRFELKAEEIKVLEIPKLNKELDTKAYISADLHVHSGVSMDSSLLPVNRVRDFVAQGAEVLVTTEHDVSYSMQPIIEQLQLEKLAVSIAGVELTGMARTEQTPTTIGHANVFPVDVDRSKFMGGTLPFEGLRLGEIIQRYKNKNEATLFQLNHPRTLAHDEDLAFFNHLSLGKKFKPTKKLDSSANRSLLQTHSRDNPYRDIDFDLMELMSGDEMESFELNKKDWYSLIKQGYYKPGTANSDSHNTNDLVALPRTYVALEKDHVGDFDQQEFLAALKKGNAMGTTGPYIEFSAGEVTMGEVAQGSELVFTVDVRSASWIKPEELLVYKNGSVFKRIKLQGDGQQTFNIPFDKDGFVNVEVNANATEIYSLLYPGHTPMAFSNPIFVDFDINGYQPPGI